MARDTTQLVLGRGEVYFDRFLPGTRIGEGERYIGNTSTFRIQRNIERKERRKAYRGQTVETDGAVISESHVVDFITDNISIENVAAWYGSDPDLSGRTSIGVVTETFLVKRGRFYQLGKSVSPGGARHVDYVRVFVDGTLVSSTNYLVEKSLGRIQVLSDAGDIADGDTISVSFEWRNATGSNAASTCTELTGTLRFISYNPEGPDTNYSFPMVRLAPKGQIDLKGDEWQQMNFEATAMRLSPLHEQVYIDRILTAGYTLDEIGILSEFDALSEFPPIDDDLNEIVNVDNARLTLSASIADFIIAEGAFDGTLNAMAITT